MSRLSSEREAEIRELASLNQAQMTKELLAEIDYLREQLEISNEETLAWKEEALKRFELEDE